MPQGLQVWGPNGEVFVDTNTRSATYLKTIELPTSLTQNTSGSFTDPLVSQGSVFVTVTGNLALYRYTSQESERVYLTTSLWLITFSTSGSTVTWQASYVLNNPGNSVSELRAVSKHPTFINFGII